MTYRFGRCELDPATRELRVDGAPRPVEPQVFDLIRFLVDHRERVVSQDELIATIWNGRLVSDSAIAARISAARTALGDDGRRQEAIRTIPRRGFRFVGAIDTPAVAAPSPVAAEPSRQRIAFCRSADGTRIAYAVSGSGTPLVKAGTWLTHLEHDWHSPIWRPFLERLSRRFQVFRYDQRGNGLSDWEVDDLPLDRFVEDMEAVVDAAGLERFALYGASQGAPIAAAYAARHPDKVSHLILHGGFERGRLVRASADEREKGQAILTLIRHGWGQSGSAFISAFATMFIPDGDRQQIASLADLQRQTTSPANAALLRAAVDMFDASPFLEGIRAPTLVLHARDDTIQPLEEGRRLAAGIANAEFVLLESRNHVILPQEPAWPDLFDAIERFVAEN